MRDWEPDDSKAEQRAWFELVPLLACWLVLFAQALWALARWLG